MGGECRRSMGETRNTYTILVGKQDLKNHIGDLGVDGRIIFNGS
jgi:hypothetical protein